MSDTFSGFSAIDNDSTILLHCNNEEGGIVETTLHNIYQVIDEITDEILFSEEDNEINLKNTKGNITEKETAETGNVRFIDYLFIFHFLLQMINVPLLIFTELGHL